MNTAHTIIYREPSAPGWRPVEVSEQIGKARETGIVFAYDDAGPGVGVLVDAANIRPMIEALARHIGLRVVDRYRLPTHTHVKRGTNYYRDDFGVELQCAGAIAEGTLLTVYYDENGKGWARPDIEFVDPARFSKAQGHPFAHVRPGKPVPVQPQVQTLSEPSVGELRGAPMDQSGDALHYMGMTAGDPPKKPRAPATLAIDGPAITITMSLGKIEDISHGLSDLGCWGRGFNAALGPDDLARRPMGLSEACDMNIILKKALRDHAKEKPNG